MSHSPQRRLPVFTVRLLALVLLFVVTAGGATSARQQQSPDADALVRSALSLYEQQKLDEALARANEAAKIYPNDYRPPAVAANVYLAQRKFKSASDSFATALALEP